MINESILASHGVTDAAIAALRELRPRDGFEFPDEEDLRGMIKFLQQEEELSMIVPVVTDNNSNYLCVFVSGEHTGLVCYLSHDEIDLRPIFTSVANMVKAINAHPDAWDVYDLPKTVFDFKELPF